MSTKAEKVRSKEDEEALDRKIAEIRKRNQLIQQRKEIVDEDRAAFEDQYGSFASSKMVQKKNNDEKVEKTSIKKNNENEWAREWDFGKTRAETWIENVPEMGLTWRGHKKRRGFYGRGRRGRGSGSFRREYSMHDDRFESASYDNKQTNVAKDAGEHSQNITQERMSEINVDDESRQQKHAANGKSVATNTSRGREARRRNRIYEPNVGGNRNDRKPNTLTAKTKPDSKDSVNYEKSVEIVKRRGGLSDTIRVKLINVNAVKQQESAVDDAHSKTVAKPETNTTDSTTPSNNDANDDAKDSTVKLDENK